MSISKFKFFQVKPRFSKASIVIFFVFCMQTLFLSVCGTARAQIVEPMVYELAPLGNESSIDMLVKNTKNSSATYELLAKKISYDEYGEESLTPADDDFLIYPPFTLIEAGKAQRIKIKYVGEPVLESSLAYRIIVAELPVDLSGGDVSGVAVGVNFSTLCYVSPNSAEPTVNVSAISREANGNWLVAIENTGNRYSRLSDSTIEFSSVGDANNKKILSELEIGDYFSKNTVAPNSKLVVSLRPLDGFKPETTQITITEARSLR